MHTDYDTITTQYQKSKRQPWRTYVEGYTLLTLLGELTDQTVVDFACGEGHYTRMFRDMGASRVVGVDQSEGMIDLARRQDTGRLHEIEYVQQDCRALEYNGEFDVAAAAYLLNYAQSREELSVMVQGIARSLRPGGRFVTVNSNPDLNFDRGEIYRKYGFEIRAFGQSREGLPYTWTFDLDDGRVEVENYLLPKSAHDEIFKAAGFAEVRWHGPKLSKIGEAEFEPGYWRELLEYPPFIGIECRLG